MANELGRMIDVVKHTFSNTNDVGEKCQLSININFNGVTDSDIKSWLCSNRVIAFARPLSKLSLEEMQALDGETFSASTIGQKIMSKQERMIAELFDKVKNDPEKLAQLNAIMNDSGENES